MILSPSNNKQTLNTMGGQRDNVSQSYADTPPTYEVAVEENNGIARVQRQSRDQKISPQAQEPVTAYQSYPSNKHPVAGPSVPSMPQTRVYHYVNPNNGNHITSLLPPDHPEMVCLQRGSHVEKTKFGFLGIIAAIVWFPLGIGLCLLDRTVTCKRCGAVIKGRPGIHLGGSNGRR
ncbi:hypothetical protein BJ322DRAFT_1064113 [Thelephora terrestris]|uniref:Brain protein I3 n=1 Tax=Thelephora terrestris TaxID=56493 RepID=A0A9P6HD66_9AGAM|nr:hypothetical protein BJ322DRAFT_1064113 [Thelephora terrestris]